ncbi:uncharacterized protein N7483_005880 [Penicillium malachiteum]|uniref:uncharacterized protein n=1 Tax=Penicillium malachiteum TaxID=1324776 RepID=UPI00254660DB|nr:uncharacterized protein N7483_005880 [Penicillium malachiteum]KAJ5731372.1 hypothetical protein N7483_005880 [Penicillium malachiteum]
MGSGASKPVRSAAGAAAKRQYPKKAAPPPRTPAAPKQAREAPQSTPYICTHTFTTIDLDGRDPDFAASLRTIGPVDPSGNFSHPNPFNRGTLQTVFPTSSNPALIVVNARQRITKAAHDEALAVGNPNFTGRQFLDSLTIHQALTMRDQQKLPSGEIERMLRLKKGTIDKLGKSGIVSQAA